MYINTHIRCANDVTHVNALRRFVNPELFFLKSTNLKCTDVTSHLVYKLNEDVTHVVVWAAVTWTHHECHTCEWANGNGTHVNAMNEDVTLADELKWATAYWFIYTCIYIYIHVYVYIYSYVYTYVYMYVYVCRYIWVEWVITMWMYHATQVNVHIYIHVYMCIYIYTHRYIYMYIWIYTYEDINELNKHLRWECTMQHMWIYICIHIHIYMYMYTDINELNEQLRWQCTTPRIWIYICIHTQMYMYMYIDTYELNEQLRRECTMPCQWSSFVTPMDDSCHACERMSYVTHVNEP